AVILRAGDGGARGSTRAHERPWAPQVGEEAVPRNESVHNVPSLVLARSGSTGVFSATAFAGAAPRVAPHPVPDPAGSGACGRGRRARVTPRTGGGGSGSV